MDPVGVASTTPSQPKEEIGALSTEMTTSSIRSRLDFSTEASFSAQVWATRASSAKTLTSIARRSSTE